MSTTLSIWSALLSVRRYAGFYLNEDPGALNYDPGHRIIKSLFNGSRGPLLRKATALDWAGDPIEVENRFHLGHGEQNYQETGADHTTESNNQKWSPRPGQNYQRGKASKY